MIYRRENFRQGLAQIMVVMVVMVCDYDGNDFIISWIFAARMREPQSAFFTGTWGSIS
jgi:hypothetical protein